MDPLISKRESKGAEIHAKEEMAEDGPEELLFLPEGLYVDLSEAIAIKAECFCRGCFPLIPLKRICSIDDEMKDEGEESYRYFRLHLFGGGEVRVLTSRLEGLRFVGRVLP